MTNPVEVVPAPQPYEAPAELLGDRGALFAFIMSSCYGKTPGALLAKMKISRQTMWSWRQDGIGVPLDRRGDIEKLIADESEPFRLPTNVTLDMILRPLKGRVPLVCVRNPYLVDLMLLIVSGTVPHLSSGTLDSIIRTHLNSVRGPHILWRWAYAAAGVPPSHAQRFQTAMHHYRVPEALNMTPEVFDAYMAKNLVAPENYGDDDT